MIERPRAIGIFIGTAIGDSLGMPVEGMSHQNIRTYYKGIKDLRADEKRGDLAAGQWTARSQALLALAHRLASGPAGAFTPLSIDHQRRSGQPPPAGMVIVAAASIGLRWAVEDWMPEDALRVTHDSLSHLEQRSSPMAAAFGHALAVRSVTGLDPLSFGPEDFVAQVAEATQWAEQRLGADSSVSERLDGLIAHLGDFPLDLQDLCGGSGAPADEAWPFAVAMFARSPRLVEAAMLSAVNVGGDSPTVGAALGGLLGGLHGVEAFPPGWRQRVEAADALTEAAERLLSVSEEER